jgi:RNA polymerase sigma-70 factor (ECF subfamily)
VSEHPDAELIARHLAGDQGAFDEIVVRYERRVWAICLRMCGDVEDARDASQDAFITTLRSLGTFRGEAQLSTWLHRVAVNASLDVIRRRARRRTEHLDDTIERASDAPGPDEEAERAHRAAEVRRALARLAPDHRAVVVLHDLQGLPYPEVAEVLDVPVGTVKSRLHRARLELARLLGHLKEVEPTRESDPLTS